LRAYSGLKPTYGRDFRVRACFPFVASFDHLGPLARSSLDLALAHDAMQGYDCVPIPSASIVPIDTAGAGSTSMEWAGCGWRLAGGYFTARSLPGGRKKRLLGSRPDLGAADEVELPEAGRARAAAYVITAAEAAALHLDRLRRGAADFDPAVRDRLIAGAMLPAAFIVKAQKFRRWYREQVLKLFANLDAIVAPATPFAAPRLGQQTVKLDGAEVPLRPNIGIFTQPISFVGLPVVVVPVPLQPLPIGVQIVVPPWREDVALRIAYGLEKHGVALAPRPPR
jgi:aspartyl-tRNA(Asn)/glutamyl-tRNA(Gln) amidotransferase subunit A